MGWDLRASHCDYKTVYKHNVEAWARRKTGKTNKGSKSLITFRDIEVKRFLMPNNIRAVLSHTSQQTVFNLPFFRKHFAIYFLICLHAHCYFCCFFVYVICMGVCVCVCSCQWNFHFKSILIVFLMFLVLAFVLKLHWWYGKRRRRKRHQLIDRTVNERYLKRKSHTHTNATSKYF